MKLEQTLTKEIEIIFIAAYFSFILRVLLFHNAAIMIERIKIEAVTMNEIIE